MATSNESRGHAHVTNSISTDERKITIFENSVVAPGRRVYNPTETISTVKIVIIAGYYREPRTHDTSLRGIRQLFSFTISACIIIILL